MLTTPEILKAGRALLEEKGWVQCSYETSEGRCAIGALRAVAVDELGSAVPYRAAFYALEDAIPKEFGCDDVPTFNDCPATTKADVLALFDRALAKVQDPAHVHGLKA